MTTCPSTVSFISSTFSTISIVSWIFAQLPQIIKNYTNKSSEGISPGFLLLWFMGDFLSFTSCLVNIDTVLKFQLYISVFFLCNDIALCFQYYHYNYVHTRYTSVEMDETQNERRVDDNDGEELPKTPMDNEDVSLYQGQDIHRISHAQNIEHSTSEDYVTSSPSSYDSTNEEGGRNITTSGSGIIKKSIVGTMLQAGKAVAMPLSSTATTVITTSDSHDSLGLFLAWGGTVLYCLSRCPQLYKNYKRKSVEGISPLLFGAALLGNLTYTLSILSSCEFFEGGAVQHEFIIKELPYILGSSGTVVFDIAYFVQKYMYSNNSRTTRGTNTMVMESWDDIESRHSNRS
ncbi:putative vacuolar amino acid transporter YPQ2 [Candida tropicalis]